MTDKHFHIHLVSDSTGETLGHVARACLAQFAEVDTTKHLWWLIRTEAQVSQVLHDVEANPGMVLFTVVDNGVRIALEEGCRHLGVPCVAVLDPVMAALAGFFEESITEQPGQQHIFDADYFTRLDAMKFAMDYDDGQLPDDLNEADIVIVGVSRTSKTPISIYLAQRGLKAANVPFVPGIPLPKAVMRVKRPLVVGLTRDPTYLTEIRVSRLRALHEDPATTYTDPEVVREEVKEARRLYTRHGWPVVDVTRKSVEEAAAAIQLLHAAHLRKRQQGEAAQ